VFLDQQELAPGELGDRLASVVRDAGDKLPLVTLRADRHLDYGRVVGVMGELNAAGFKSIALVTNGSVEAP
jgi:biopolymer transport protein TolR